MENDAFQVRVRGAAVAGWWVVLIAYIILIVQWLVYLVIVPAQPAWFLSLWGADFTWSQVQTIWLNAMITIKLGVFAGASLALWLTLWSRQLRRSSGAA